MSNIVKIAIDAMGGENSPKKIIEGIDIAVQKNKNNFFIYMAKKI
jgi:glycerol-3-phosphate acyltransferase PlsX